MHSITLRLVFATVLAVAASGCLPDAVVWTPDGKSLIYTEDRGTRLIRFDLEKKERLVLEANTNTQTTWPGVSPDGKRIAVARVVRHADQPGTLEIELLDMAGKEGKSSKEFPWLPADKKGKGKRTYAAALYWDAGSKRILVFSEGTTGIYDPVKDALVLLENVVPLPVGNVPARPDGTGFLGLLTDGDRTEIAFFNWSGKRQKIERGDNELKAAEVFWEKDTAHLVSAAGVLDIDTAKLSVVFRAAAKPELLPADGDLTCLHTFADGKTKVCVYDWIEKTKTIDIANQRIEIQRPGEKKREVIERRTRGLVSLYPSPDRKLVAVRYRPEGSPTQLIAIIDANGKIVQEIGVKD